MIATEEGLPYVSQLIDQLIRHEGLRLKPYTDTVGKLTIGVGRNLTDVGLAEEEARYLLYNDVARTVRDLSAALPWFDTLDGIRREVLINMAFNMGVAALLTFHHTLDLVKTGHYQEAADAMLQSKWAQQVGPRAHELAQQMRNGVYSQEV